ncbi:Fanconi anemia group D2 protein, partial [Dinochytrium kinnereticum]
MMDENSDMVVQVLDSLGTIGVPTEVLPEIIDSVISQLERAEMEHVPIVLRFLLQTTNKENVVEVIGKIRRHLNFAPISQNEPAEEKGSSAEMLILDSLKTGVKCQKFILDSWLKVIANLKDK